MKYKKAFVQNKIVDADEAVIPIATAGFQYGIGCIEGIRGYVTSPGKVSIFMLEEHIVRLLKSAQLLSFKHSYSKESILKNVYDFVRSNRPSSDFYLRPIMYRSDTNIMPGVDGTYDIAMHMIPLPSSLNKGGQKLIVSSFKKASEDILHPQAKAIAHYMGAALAMHEAHSKGFDNALLLNKDGNVAEGAVMNVFIVKNSIVKTPHTHEGLLPGITRNMIMRLGRNQGFSVKECSLTVNDLYTADEVFTTGTATGVSWVSQVGNKRISSQKGEITRKLAQLLQNAIKNEGKTVDI